MLVVSPGELVVLKISRAGAGMRDRANGLGLVMLDEADPGERVAAGIDDGLACGGQKLAFIRHMNQHAVAGAQRSHGALASVQGFLGVLALADVAQEADGVPLALELRRREGELDGKSPPVLVPGLEFRRLSDHRAFAGLGKVRPGGAIGGQVVRGRQKLMQVLADHLAGIVAEHACGRFVPEDDLAAGIKAEDRILSGCADGPELLFALDQPGLGLLDLSHVEKGGDEARDLVAAFGVECAGAEQACNLGVVLGPGHQFADPAAGVAQAGEDRWRLHGQALSGRGQQVEFLTQDFRPVIAEQPQEACIDIVEVARGIEHEDGLGGLPQRLAHDLLIRGLVHGRFCQVLHDGARRKGGLAAADIRHPRGSAPCAPHLGQGSKGRGSSITACASVSHASLGKRIGPIPQMHNQGVHSRPLAGTGGAMRRHHQYC